MKKAKKKRRGYDSFAVPTERLGYPPFMTWTENLSGGAIIRPVVVIKDEAHRPRAARAKGKERV